MFNFMQHAKLITMISYKVETCDKFKANKSKAKVRCM